MEQILIVEDDSFLNKMWAYNLTADAVSYTHLDVYKRQSSPSWSYSFSAVPTQPMR